MSAGDQFPVQPGTPRDAAEAGGVLRPDYDPFAEAPQAKKTAAAPLETPPADGGVVRPDFDPFRVGEDPKSPENVRLSSILTAATVADWSKSNDALGRARRIGAVSQITKIPVDTLAAIGDSGIDEIEKRARLVANDPVRFRRQYPALADALLNSGESRNFVVTQAPAVSRFVRKLGVLFSIVSDTILQTMTPPVQRNRQLMDALAKLSEDTSLTKEQYYAGVLKAQRDYYDGVAADDYARNSANWNALSEIDDEQTYRKAGPNAPDSTVEAAKNSFKDLKRLAILGKIYVGNGTPEDELALARINESMVPTDPSGQGPVRQVVNVGAQMLGMQAANIASRGAGGGIAYGLAAGGTLAVTRNPATANKVGITAAKFGGKAAEVAAIYGQTLLSAYGAYRDTLDEEGRPIDDATAKIVAAAYAAVATAALAKGQSAIYAAYGKVLGGAAASGEEQFGRQILGNKQLREALLREYGKRIATATATEGSAMAVQTLGQDAGEWLARNASAYGLGVGQYKAPTREEIHRAFANTAEQGLGGAIMGFGHSSLGATTGYYRSMHEYHQDVARAKAMPEVAKTIAENKDLAIALPKTVASMIETETGATGDPVTHVYLDAKAVVREAQRADGTVDSDLLDAIGERLTGKTGKEAGDAVLDAANSGQRIEMSMADYLRYVATTNLASRLASDTAVNPVGFTAREHALYRPQIVERAKALVDQWEKEGRPTDDPAADADADRVRRQLDEENARRPEANRATDDELDRQADVYRAMHLATLAAWNSSREARGEAPLTYADLFGGVQVEVGHGQAGETLHALGDLLAPEEGKTEETLGQEGLHGGTSSTIAEEGGFDLDHVGSKNGASYGHGVYFTNDEETARRYQDGGKVYRADLPEDDALLDYDGTLDKQPAKVRSALIALLGLQPADAEVVPDPEGGFKIVVRNGEGREIDRTWAADADAAQRLADDYRTSGPLDPHMSGGEMYEELAIQRGGQRAASDALREAGVPGLRYEQDGKRGYVVWDADRMPIRETLAEGPAPTPAPKPPPVSGGAAEARRGWTTILADGAKRIYKVMLSPTADFSTFAHESAHVYIDIMSVLASRDDAPEQYRKDYETALKWMGYADHAERESVRPRRAALAARAERMEEIVELRRKVAAGDATEAEAIHLRDLEMTAHPLTDAEQRYLDGVTEREERFARGFEAYLMEGKAPSAALAGVFERFKIWLTNIYGSSAALGVTLNDDIRGVFDRMLASDREIEATRDALAMRPLYRSPEEAGMTPEEWRDYLAEQDDGLKLASRRMASKYFADRAREHGLWWRNERARAAEEARQEYAARPGVRLLRLIQKGLAWDGMPEALQRLLVKGADGVEKKVRIKTDDAKAILDGDARRTAEAELVSEEARVAALGEKMLAETRARQKQLRLERDAAIGKEQERARGERKFHRDRAKNAENPVDRYESAKRVGEIGAELDKTVETLRGDYDKAIREEQAKLDKWREDRRGELAKRRREIEETTESEADVIAHLCAKDGISAELLAEWTGYDSAAAMLHDLVGTPKEADYTRERADEIMQERHPDVANEWQALHEEAEKALHNDHNGKWLASELSSLAARKVPGGPRTPVESIRLAARQIVEKRAAARTTTGSDLQAEQRAARDALAYAARGEHERAYAAKLQQVLNFWIYREAQRASEERDAFSTMLSRTKRRDDRGRIRRAGDSLGDLAEWMLEAFGRREYVEDETLPPSTHPLEAAARLRDLGITPDFDPVALAETLTTKDWKTLTVEEMRNAYAALKQIRLAGRQMDKIDVLGRKVAVADLVSEMGAEASELHDRGAIPAANTPRPFGYAAAEKIAGVNAALTEPRVLFEFLGKKAYDFFYRGYRRCRDSEDAMIRAVMPFFMDEWRAFCRGDENRRFEEVDASELPFRKELGMDGRRTRLWAIMLAVAMGTQSNRDRTCGVKVLDKHGDPVLDADGNPIIKGGFGWDQDKVIAWLDKTLRPDEWDFVESVWRVMDKELWPRLAKMERDVHGVAPDKIAAVPIVLSDGRVVSGGYYPLRPDPRVRNAASDKAADADALAAFGAFGGGSAMDRSFTHERVNHADYVVDLDWNVVPQHIIDVLHYVAFYGFVRDAQRVLTNPDFSNVLKRRLGSKAEGALNDWLKSVANARSSSIAKTERYILDFMDPFRARFIMRSLGASITTPLGDLSNTLVAVGGGVIKARYILPRLISSLGVAPWLAMRRECLELSNTLRRRADLIKTRLRIEMGEVGRAGAKGDASRSLDTVRMAAWYLYEFTDSLCATVMWKGAYEQAKAEGKSELDARAFADDAIDRLLPSPEAPEQSGFVRSRTVGAPQAAFYGYFSKIYNLEREIWHPAAQAWLKGDGMTSYAPKAMRAAIRTAGVFISANIIGELLSGRGPERDEKWAEWAARKAAAAPFMMIPMYGSLGEWGVNAAFHKMFHDKQGPLAKFSVRASPAMSGMQTLYEDIAAALDSKKEGDQRFWSAIDATSTALKLPGHNVRRPAEYAERWAAGKTKPKGPLDAAGHLIYGERRKQASNPLSAASEFAGEGEGEGGEPK